MWMLVRRCGEFCAGHVRRFFYAIYLDDSEDARTDLLLPNVILLQLTSLSPLHSCPNT
jgi:hypothetical protein